MAAFSFETHELGSNTRETAAAVSRVSSRRKLSSAPRIDSVFGYGLLTTKHSQDATTFEKRDPRRVYRLDPNINAKGPSSAFAVPAPVIRGIYGDSDGANTCLKIVDPDVEKHMTNHFKTSPANTKGWPMQRAGIFK